MSCLKKGPITNCFSTSEMVFLAKWQKRRLYPSFNLTPLHTRTALSRLYVEMSDCCTIILVPMLHHVITEFKVIIIACARDCHKSNIRSTPDCRSSNPLDTDMSLVHTFLVMLVLALHLQASEACIISSHILSRFINILLTTQACSMLACSTSQLSTPCGPMATSEYCCSNINITAFPCPAQSSAVSMYVVAVCANHIVQLGLSR